MKKSLSLIIIFLAGLFWGTMGVFVKVLNAYGLSSNDIGSVRLFAATVLLFVLLLIKDKSLLKIKLRDLWIFLGSGIASLAFFTLAYYRTILTSSISIAAVLLYLSPAFVIAFSCIFLKDKLTFAKVLSCIVCILGCAFVTGAFESDVKVPFIALVTGLISAVCYALYSIFSKVAISRGYNTMTIVFYTFLLAFVATLPFANINNIVENVSVSPVRIAVAILMSVITAFAPYVLYSKGLENTDAGKAAVIVAVEPVFATVLSIVFYHETFSALQVVGIVLVLSAIVLSNTEINLFKKRKGNL